MTRNGIRGLGGRVLVVAVAYLVGGLFGALVAVAAVVALETEPPGTVAWAAAGALAAAAAATVFQRWPDNDFDSRFATDRPLAAGLGQAAAILAFVAVAWAGREERSAPHPRRSVAWPTPRITRAHAQVVASAAAAGLLAALVRAVSAPEAVPPGYADAVEALRTGNGFVSASHPPLTAVLTALAPVGTTLLTAVVTMATAAVIGVLGERVGGRRAGVVSALLAATLPSVWGQQLPEALAALGGAAALAWAWPDRLSPRRAVLAGLAVAAASLARPEATLLLPVVVAWVAVARGLDWRAARLALVVIVVFLVGYGPWGTWMADVHGTYLPSTNLGATLAGANTPSTQRGSASGAFDAAGVSGAPLQPGLGEAARDRALRSVAWDQVDKGRLPGVAIIRVLRGWELWWPGNARAVRAERGLPFPGGTVGGLAEVAVSVLALTSLVVRRREWRRLLPFLVLPVLFTIESALLFGDRGLRAWVVPVVVVLAAVALARDRPRPAHARSDG